METRHHFDRMARRRDRCHKNSRAKKLVFGLMLLLVGIFLIGFNTGFISEEYRHIIFSWQMLLIAIGIVNIFDWRSIIPGVILILVGGFFILPELHTFDYEVTKLLWPVIIILLGLLIIFSGFIRRHRYPPTAPNFPPQFSDSKINDLGYIDEVNIFSGKKHSLTSREFKGGKITNIFGGSELDLTQVALAESQNYLEIICIFGGVSITVPSDWNVIVRVKPFLGGFSDQRRFIKTNGDNPKKELIITGVAIFGGGEIKSM
jgi:predicted membrane protein